MTYFGRLFFSAFFLLKWLILIIWCSFYSTATSAENLGLSDIFSQLDIPEKHQIFIEKIFSEKESQCLKNGIDFELEIDPDAVFLINLSDAGERATIFHSVFTCNDLGNLWTATMGTQTYILVGDKVFQNWLMAPPLRLIIAGKIFLLLSLDETQCTLTNNQLYVDAVATCYALLRWVPKEKSFFGFGIPLEENLIASYY